MTSIERRFQPGNEKLNPNYRFEKWRPEYVNDIFRLEQKGWAPWLRRPKDQIVIIAEKFPDTQLIARDDGGSIVGAMTANRINWDGKAESLTSYDAVVGGNVESSNYTKTHKPDGNTICVIASAIDPTVKKTDLGIKLLQAMKEKAEHLNVEHLIAPFRPNKYGEYKLHHLGQNNFAEYCEMYGADGRPHDPWLRSASRLGMEHRRVEERSLNVSVTLEKFEEYKRTYNPNLWIEIQKGVWECGETGNWTVNGNKALYYEPNLWGEFPLRKKKLQTQK